MHSLNYVPALTEEPKLEVVSRLSSGILLDPLILWDTRVVTGLGHKYSHSLGPWFEPRKGTIRLWYRRYQVEYPLVGDGAANTTGASAPAG